jgi:tRNA-dihydrouridine synthase
MKFDNKLPWTKEKYPLMLAPMQGLTNRALRSLFINKYRPDVVFTEYVRALPGCRKGITNSDKEEIIHNHNEIQTVVQLIGGNTEALTTAAETAQQLGAKHININLGCPYGRMHSNAAGGNLLQKAEVLPEMLSSLRNCIDGSFSVKIRSGYDNPDQVFELISMFEVCEIDFIVLHPRTVTQRYSGIADHQVTAELVRLTSIPIIANGDICTCDDGSKIIHQTAASGLMIGRGAISDPFIFERLRGHYPAISSAEERNRELQNYLLELLDRYKKLFCGEQQIIYKMLETLNQIHDPGFNTLSKKLRKSKNLTSFTQLLLTVSAY